MLNVGLTGGIATGKSTVAGMLREKGAVLIDFDGLTRLVQEPGQPAWKAIVECFGHDVLNADKTINREKLGEIVFSRREKLEKLNDIAHPFIFQQWHALIARIREEAPDAIVVSDIPLLIETGVQHLFDIIVLVYASPQKQMERLMKRSGLSREEAMRRIASQMPIDDKVPHAALVIDNGFSPEQTRRRVGEVWNELLRRREPLTASENPDNGLHGALPD